MAAIDLLDDLFDLPDEAPTMNEALVAWAEDHPREAAPAERAGPVRGPCSHCAGAATTRCLRCARPVCARHHHVMVGICDRCTDEATEAQHSAADERSAFADELPPPRPDLDLDWIE